MCSEDEDRETLNAMNESLEEIHTICDDLTTAGEQRDAYTRREAARKEAGDGEPGE